MAGKLRKEPAFVSFNPLLVVAILQLVENAAINPGYCRFQPAKTEILSISLG
jgi:hypothetical protein